jgi:regulator of sigma E protease
MVRRVGALFIVLMICGLIVVHELGHFLVARAMGVHVTEFAVGVGPRVLAWKGRARHPDLPPTDYVLALLPFGGYVKMLGYDPGDEVPPGVEAVSFAHKAVWRRFLIMVAGPAFNLILPFFLFFVVGLAEGRLEGSVVGTADPDWPAWKAGIRPGDRIVAIDGEPVSYWWQLREHFGGRAGEAVPVTIERMGERRVIPVTPVAALDNVVPGVVAYHRGRIGVEPRFSRPLVGVTPGSVAAAAGISDWDRVVAVDGKPVRTLEEALEAVGRDPARPVSLGLLGWEAAPTEASSAEGPGPGAATGALRVSLARPRVVTLAPADGARGLFSAECLVFDVVPGSPAAALGLRRGDRLLEVGAQPCVAWSFAARSLHAQRTEPVRLVWQRDGQRREGTLSHAAVAWPTARDQGAERLIHGIVVLQERLPPELVDNEAPLAFALHRMAAGTFDAIGGTVAMLGGLLSGRVAVKDGLGGPVLIGQLAAEAGEAGWDKFLALMAGISVSLGIINLLPIPLLDGGQILFLAIEGVRRRPVSVRIRMIATYLGLAFIVALMVIVLRNDIARVWGG